MTEDKQEAEFKSLLVKASRLESQLEVYDTADESHNLYQEDLGFIMAFDVLLEHRKQARANRLRFDFLGVVIAKEDAIARNDKHYLKIRLQDIHGKTHNLCLFEETAHYCSVQEFTERYLLSEHHSLIFIQSLQWDGNYLSADKLTLFEHGENHPQAAIYKQVEEYLQLKLLPKNNNLFAESISSSCLQADTLVQKILAFLETQKELVSLPQTEHSNTLSVKITEIVYSKTYSGSSYLLQGEKQSPITSKYANYFLGQLQTLLEMVVRTKKLPVPLSKMVLHCIIERWRRETVSLHDFERIQNQGIH